MKSISIINMKFPEMIKMNQYVHYLIDNTNSPEFIFTFNKLKWIDPSGAIILMETLTNLKEMGASVTFEPIEDETRAAISYGMTLGIFQEIGLSTRNSYSEGNTYLAPTKINMKDVYEDLEKEHQNTEYYFDYISEKLTKKILKDEVVKQDKKLNELFMYVVRELIRNIFDHSKSKYFYCGSQFLAKTQVVEFVIADRGVGLKKTVPFDIEEKWFNQDTTENAIRKAFVPGISAASNHSYASEDYLNSGYGLAMVKSLMLAANGTLSMATADKSMTYTEKEVNIENCNIQGTIIRVRVDLEQLSTVNFEEQLATVEKEAEMLGISTKPSGISKTLSKYVK